MIENGNIINFISKMNEDNYDYFKSASTKEELGIDIYKHLLDNELIIGDENNLSSIEELIEWEGQGEYVLSGWGNSCCSIIKLEKALECELGSLDFPFLIDSDVFLNNKKWVESVKKDEGFKHIYLVYYMVHVNTPYQYHLTHIVKSNKQIENVINYLNENKDIFIGEFGTLGANHFVEELEELSVYNLDQYTFEDYQVIEVE